MGLRGIRRKPLRPARHLLIERFLAGGGKAAFPGGPAADILSAFRAAAAVLLVGNLLIVCHELGHFMDARCLGVRVLWFTIAFGPVIARRIDARRTVWTLSLLPLGGYVGFEGERDTARPGSYVGKSPLARMAIIAAGPAANIGSPSPCSPCSWPCSARQTFCRSPAPSSPAARRTALASTSAIGCSPWMASPSRRSFEGMRPGVEGQSGQDRSFHH
jgi:Peptidase family M50